MAKQTRPEWLNLEPGIEVSIPGSDEVITIPTEDGIYTLWEVYMLDLNWNKVTLGYTVTKEGR